MEMSIKLKYIPVRQTIEEIHTEETKDFPVIESLFDIDDTELYNDQIKNAEDGESDTEVTKDDKQRIKMEEKIEKERIKAEKIKEKDKLNEEKKMMKEEKNRQIKEGKKCQWKIVSGIRIGMLCGNPIDGGDAVGADRYCKECLNKTTLKVKLAAQTVSPTLTRLKDEVEKNPNVHGDLFSRIEFSLADYYEVYMRKTGTKLIRDKSSPALKNLSYHWKFIIEVVTANKEFSFQMAAILKMAIQNRIKVLKDKKFWLLENNRWMISNREECILKVKRFKEEFLLKCLDILTSLNLSEDDSTIEVLDISNKIKTSFETKISKEVIEILLQNIIDKTSTLTEHPLGERFIAERLIFTNDKRYYGITTSILYEAREKWIKENPTCEIQPYNLLQLGRLICTCKLWESEIGAARIRRHLGIKLKPI